MSDEHYAVEERRREQERRVRCLGSVAHELGSLTMKEHLVSHPPIEDDVH